MKRLAVMVLVGVLVGCGGGTKTTSRDKCEAQYGVGDCVSRHGSYVPLGLPLAVGTSTTRATNDECPAMSDAAKAGSAVFYALNGSVYPKTFADMENTTPPILELPNGASGTGTVLHGSGWTLTMTGGGTTTPTFTCSG